MTVSDSIVVEQWFEPKVMSSDLTGALPITQLEMGS